MTVVALVPARGGSRGLPGKNLATVGGRSLVARAVATAREVRGVDEVVVSSDDPPILEAGREAGATAMQRPAALAQDTTTAIDVVRAFLDGRPDVEVVVLLQPTSPLRVSLDVQRCLDALAAGATTVATVAPIEHPLEWSFRLGSAGRLDPVFGWAAMTARRQDAAAVYVLNGAVYAARAAHLSEGGQLVGPDTVAVVMPRERSVDIDDATDLLLARAIADPSGVAP